MIFAAIIGSCLSKRKREKNFNINTRIFGEEGEGENGEEPVAAMLDFAGASALRAGEIERNERVQWVAAVGPGWFSLKSKMEQGYQLVGERGARSLF